jgi:IstB-like ATP binding protein
LARSSKLVRGRACRPAAGELNGQCQHGACDQSRRPSRRTVDGKDKRPELQMPETRHYDAGPTGTGKTHLAIAIARSCIRSGVRGRFYNVVDLVNRLETETRNGRQGRLADHLTRMDFIVLDELATVPIRRRLTSRQEVTQPRPHVHQEVLRNAAGVSRRGRWRRGRHHHRRRICRLLS